MRFGHWLVEACAKGGFCAIKAIFPEIEMQSQSGLTKNSLLTNCQDFAESKWNNLNDRQKTIAKRFWGILTYKWQWQIALNAPFMLLWILDSTIPSVHTFDMALLQSLPLPTWIQSFWGIG